MYELFAGALPGVAAGVVPLGFAGGGRDDVASDDLFWSNAALVDLIFGVEVLAFRSGRAAATGCGLATAGCAEGFGMGADGFGRATFAGGFVASASSALRFGGGARFGVADREILGVLPAEPLLPG